MKTVKNILLALLLTGFAATTLPAGAADEAKPKPYTLEKCLVSDEKLGEHGKPYVFTHEGQEIKLCCKSCLKDFQKEPEKFTKKLEEEQKKTTKKP